MAGLKFTSATTIWYHEGDVIGKVLAYGSFTPYLAILYSAFVAYHNRNLTWLMVFIGFVFNEVIARGLKHVIRQERPQDTCKALDTCDSHGMPSSHTACIVFAFVLRLCFLRLGKQSTVNKFVQVVEVVALLSFSGIVGWSRVYLGYHSVDQVLAGACLGALIALVWSRAIVSSTDSLSALCKTPVGFALQLTCTQTTQHKNSKSKQT